MGTFTPELTFGNYRSGMMSEPPQIDYRTIVLGTQTFVDGTNFPGQETPNDGILAAVMFTVAGGVVTVVGQKNVATVTRNAAGYFTIAFTSALGSEYYGVLCGSRAANTFDTGQAQSFMNPAINSTGGKDQYSTTQLTVINMGYTGTPAYDPEIGTIIVFDPATVGSQYLAAFMGTTPPGATVTLRSQTNVSSITRNGVGLYTQNFTVALPTADYSPFGTSRWQSFAGGDFGNVWGRNQYGGGGGFNRQTVDVFDLWCAGLLNGGQDDQFKFSGLFRDSSTFPRGTLASVRFTYIGGIVTLVKSWNVASVNRISTGIFEINYDLPTSDTNYGVLGSVSTILGGVQNNTPLLQVNAQITGGHNKYSTTQLNVHSAFPSSSAIDCEYYDVWVVKPWLM